MTHEQIERVYAYFNDQRAEVEEIVGRLIVDAEQRALAEDVDPAALIAEYSQRATEIAEAMVARVRTFIATVESEPHPD